jgi:hypothetical protein
MGHLSGSAHSESTRIQNMRWPASVGTQSRFTTAHIYGHQGRQNSAIMFKGRRTGPTDSRSRLPQTAERRVNANGPGEGMGDKTHQRGYLCNNPAQLAAPQQFPSVPLAHPACTHSASSFEYFHTTGMSPFPVGQLATQRPVSSMRSTCACMLSMSAGSAPLPGKTQAGHQRQGRGGEGLARLCAFGSFGFSSRRFLTPWAFCISDQSFFLCSHISK